LLVDGGIGDDGTIADMPWASVFSPTANARALNAIQAEGFRAASQLVDRFVRAVGPPDPQSDNGNGNASLGSSATDSDLERLTRAWWSMFGQLLLGAAPGAQQTAFGAPTLAFGRQGTGSVALETTGPGWVTTEVWLHNNTATDFGAVTLHCSELLAHCGHRIAAAAVQCGPDPVPVPARSSRGVPVRVHVAPFDPPGVYRGILLAAGHPELWLPVALTVRAALA
jgi:hypothetical protein